MDRRQSEEMSLAAQRMAEATEELSRSVERFASEQQAAMEQIYRYWATFERPALEEGETSPPWRPVPLPPILSEEDAVLLAVQSVREVRKEMWGAREAEAPTPDKVDVARWVRAREDRRLSEGYRPI